MTIRHKCLGLTLYCFHCILSIPALAQWQPDVGKSPAGHLQEVQPSRVFRTMQDARAAGELGVKAAAPEVANYQLKEKSMGAGSFTWFGPMDIALLIGIGVALWYFFALRGKKKQKRENRD